MSGKADLIGTAIRDADAWIAALHRPFSRQFPGLDAVHGRRRRARPGGIAITAD